MTTSAGPSAIRTTSPPRREVRSTPSHRTIASLSRSEEAASGRGKAGSTATVMVLPAGHRQLLQPSLFSGMVPAWAAETGRASPVRTVSATTHVRAAERRLGTGPYAG